MKGGNSVFELEKAIRKMVEGFFDEKTKRASISDELKTKFEELVDKTVVDMCEILKDADLTIDYDIREESAPKYSMEQELNDRDNFIYNCQI